MASRKAGRPRRTEKDTRVIGCVMEIDHVDRLDEVAAALNLTRSDAMRTALLEFMERNAEAAPQHQEALPVAS